MHAEAERSISRTQIPTKLQLKPNSVADRPHTSAGRKEARYGEGPLLLRVLLVLSSMSPLFLLWAIRGTDLMPEWTFWTVCSVLFVAPNLFLWTLILRARNKKIQRTIEVGETDDRRQDLISYLFAMLLPFYAVDLSSWRNFAATVVAFLIVVVLFTSLNLHYMNFLVALTGYHCFQVRTPETEHTTSSATSFMVVTKNPRIRRGTSLTGYLISSTLLLEVRE